MTWADMRTHYYDIYAQKVNSHGEVQWTADGVGICTAADIQVVPQIIPDGSSGAMITWHDLRHGNWDVYAESVDSNGNIPDHMPPTVILSSTATSPTKTSPIPMTATFSEPVTGFNIDDIVVGNGAAGFVSARATTYTFVLIPGGQGSVTVDVAANVALDAAGNGNAAATQFSISYDTVSPTVILTSTATSPTKTSPIPVTATFSEAVTGFVVDDIVVNNGTAGNFVAVSGTVYTFDVTPSGQGTVTVTVAADVALDAAGNGNVESAWTIGYGLPPTITSFTTSSTADGEVVIITGTNFTGATAVRIGNTDALDFAVDSDTQITATVKPGTSGRISVTTPAGTATSDREYVSPSSTSGSGKGWLIGGIIGGVLVLGAVAGLLEVTRRRRRRSSA